MDKFILSKISAERTRRDAAYMAPTFFHMQKAYTYAMKHIKNKDVLEVGFGDGYGAYRVSKSAKRVIAIDKDKRAVERAQKIYKGKNLIYRQAFFEDYKDGKKADVVIAMHIIEHVRDVRSFITRIRGCLKENGKLVIATPNRMFDTGYENPYHVREFTAEELFEVLGERFKKVEIWGIHGNHKYWEFEKKRRSQVEMIITADILGIRYLLPNKWLRRVFDILTFINRKMISRKMDLTVFSEESFKILKSVKGAVDLIAVAQV